MKWFVTLLFLATILVGAETQAKTPLQTAREIERDILQDAQDRQVKRLLGYMDVAVNEALKRSIKELRSRGHEQTALEIESEWAFYYNGSIYSVIIEVQNGRPIGDHQPISQWLAEKYNLIEYILGVDLCKRLHLSDIKSLNHGIPVVIKPCSFPMDGVSGSRSTEYARHFAGGPHGDDTYYGVVPVVTYWAVFIGCSGATSGLGSFGLCTLAGSLGQRVMGYFSPGLGEKLYGRICE